ncbi:T9SS type B sorting domain-containing protein [Flavobacterium subsaxonicum]|uniref:T9SS type B sorting domain-containing protein n=1 Tax=Flavobacterium subsaxonicum TaxID=426226 RepID=UPI0009DC27F7|nr:T9SS type B sorting domain-containing protein [Flavobacterium subsaxonicum]
MKCIRFYCLLVSLLYIPQLHAQLCSGSLGDPVVKIDFGSGTAIHGAALGSGITSYTYTSANFPNDGSYTIESTTNTPGTWWTTTDHTGGGYMMVVNASLSITDYFYKKTVTGLCPDTTYEFASWIMNLLKSNDTSTPNITFTIESESGTILASYNTGNIAMAGSALWTQYGFYFDTPAGVDTVVIRMRNNKVGAAPGNDIALDDITFRACGPLVTSVVNNNTATSFNVCEGQVPQYTFTGSITTSVYSDPSYQWQVSTDSGTTWTDMPGETNTTLTVQPQTAGTYMYRMATAQAETITSVTCRVVSNIITIVVNPAPNAPTVTTTPADCATSNGSLTITAPAGNTYSIDGTNYVATTLFSNLPEGDYNVTAKNSSGCISAITIAHVELGGALPATPTVTAAAPLTCADALGTLTVQDASPYYSFDNGATWVTTNTLNAVPGDYLIMVKNAAGCASLAATATIPAASGFPPVPILNITQPDCITPTGTITIADSQTAYSFNNGATWVSTTTLSNIAPGTYNILTKNSLGCVSDPAIAIINAYVNGEPLPVAASPQIFCVYNNATTSTISVTGTNVQWYANATGGSALSASALLQTGTYYATQTVNICESLRVSITIQVLDVAAPTGAAAQQFCTTQNPTVALLEATGTGLQWYDAATSGTLLASDTALISGTTYYGTQTIDGCESQARLAVTVTIISPSIPVSDVANYVCDDLNDNSEIVDLTAYNSQITVDGGVTFSYYTSAIAANTADTSGLIADPAAYAVTVGINTIYVRVDSADKCHQVVTITLTVIAVPVIPIEDTLYLCENSQITISAGRTFDSYTWSTGATTNYITITQAGSYWLTVTQNHGDVVCTVTKNFTVVLSNSATISSIEINDWTDDDNTVEVYVSSASIGSYEYSIDGANYQDSNIFTDLEIGVYTIYVRDKNGCGGTDKEVYLLNYPKFFTPNGDGSHDNWHVKFAAYEPGLKTRIFDRYGKLLTELSYLEAWDGTYNGQALPSTDYWFVVIRSNGKQYKGHFSMVR